MAKAGGQSLQSSPGNVPDSPFLQQAQHETPERAASGQRRLSAAGSGSSCVQRSRSLHVTGGDWPAGVALLEVQLGCYPAEHANLSQSRQFSGCCRHALTHPLHRCNALQSCTCSCTWCLQIRCFHLVQGRTYRQTQQPSLLCQHQPVGWSLSRPCQHQAKWQCNACLWMMPQDSWC